MQLKRETQPPTDVHLDVLVFFLLLLQDLKLLENRLLLEFSPFNLRAQTKYTQVTHTHKHTTLLD